MTIALGAGAADVALAEAQALFAMVEHSERRARIADLIAALQEGELGDDEQQALEELLELGLASGRIRAVYGPEGEQAAAATYRRLSGGRDLAASARGVTDALSALEGRPLERVTVQAPAPGGFLVTIAAAGLELSLRLDRSGARVHSVGV